MTSVIALLSSAKSEVGLSDTDGGPFRCNCVYVIDHANWAPAYIFILSNHMQQTILLLKLYGTSLTGQLPLEPIVSFHIKMLEIETQ